MSACDYDIAINGGGMVGAALACALGDGPWRVALLETARLPPPGPEVDLRVSAITLASQRFFQTLGAWEAMTHIRVGPFREMHVWDATGPGQIHFTSAAVGEAQLGWIIENRVIQAALLERCQSFANVQLLCPAALETAAVDADGVALLLEDGRQFSARLLVGADGANSRVRRLAGIEVGGWGYDQKAVVSTVRTEQSHRETAWQRFLPDGPLAFLPLPDGCCSIVWSTAPDRADALLHMDDKSFAQALGEAFAWRLGEIIDVGRRGAFPLRLLHARAYVKPRIALIGDAAHVVHPLAGQGVNLGLLDAAALAEVLTDADRRAADPGALKVLRRYERWRKGDNLLMQGVLDGFKRLFGSDLAMVRWLRNAGLTLTDTATPVKQALIRRAMGLAGDLPRLARGDRL
ncbi:MAG: UbiH/UbiF/VisC/COQ6 family ubiquinone biosynthesis hydroxylase [Pseudomonadota bacterium]|nr:UbiH/UbiF/VisC/COQ6 family ubiquinone biosynthesis hydroxylase [Pseudomonadota bacterium]